MPYIIFLSARYLKSKIIPLLAVGAVALCVALIIVVVSVMSGFLNMIRASGSRLMGDAVISYPIAGIPWFEELEKILSLEPEIDSATSIVESFGLLKMPYPYGETKQTATVQVWGINSESFRKVTDYEKSIFWKSVPSIEKNWLTIDSIINLKEELLPLLNQEEKKQLINEIEPFLRPTGLSPIDLISRIKKIIPQNLWQQIINNDNRIYSESVIFEEGLSLHRNGEDGLIAGIHVSDGNSRNKLGQYDIAAGGYWWMPRFDVTLTMLPIDSSGGISEPESTRLPILNEFQSGLYAIDDHRVFIPIKLAQKLLHLNKTEIIDPEDPLGPPLGTDPPRATHVFAKSAQGYSSNDAKKAAIRAYKKFKNKMAIQKTLTPPPSMQNPSLTINTWEEQQAAFIGPVEKERELMRTLFGIVYIVCAALILSIFWSIVSEKTRDIGILRAIGSSRFQIIQIFLLYGTSVGIIGSIAGIGLGWIIIKNINAIHSTLGNPPLLLGLTPIIVSCAIALWILLKIKSQKTLPIVVGTLLAITFLTTGLIFLYLHLTKGIIVWDPAVYYFSEIPNEMDYSAAIIAATGAIFFSLLGALIPAAKAADTDPIKALRYE